MILFLDFDGVLHPEGEDHILNGGVDFCFLPRLESLLREFPHVKIVISSSLARASPLQDIDEALLQ